MKRYFFLPVLGCFAVFFLWAQRSQSDRKQISLPTSKLLSTPVPGRIGAVNSFPAAVAVSPDQRFAAVIHDGYGTQQARGLQSISVLDLKTNQITDFPDDRFSEDAHQTLFLGLAFSGDGSHLYASVGSLTDPTGETPGNTGNGIAVYKFRDGKVEPERFVKIPPQKLAVGKRVANGLRKTQAGTAIPYPAGLAVINLGESEKLLVANNLSDNVVLLDAASGRVLQSFDLSNSDLVPSSFPYTVIATRDGHRAWCSLWNASRVAELDLTKGGMVRWIPLSEPKDPLAPGSHPTAMLLSRAETLLYIALSNADAVAVVPTGSDHPSGLLKTTILGRDATWHQGFAGSYPNALALSADQKRLFVAAASLNAVAVFDVSQMSRPAPLSTPGIDQPLGFIPTDWYPSALATIGDDLLIASAKGQGSGPNDGPNQIPSTHRHREHPYIATLMAGSLARLKISDIEKNLAGFTSQVEQDNLLHADAGKMVFQGGKNPIRHVIYVIRENRTYDQILGDLKVGNGDPKLTMYGAEITPNAHKLALQFGVLDNFYDSGEVSGDGHLWSTAAVASDYNEKTWQIAYRGKERTYDFGGTVADEFMLDHNLPDVDDPATGFLWDNLARHGITYRDYGEFIGAVWCKEEAAASTKEGTPSPLAAVCPKNATSKGELLPRNVGQPHGSPSPWPWPVPLMQGAKPSKAVLRDHYDPLYADFEVDYPDQLRADEFLNEFEGFVNARKQGKGIELPAFVLLYLPDDHTGGTRPDKPKPEASVADNDLALGRVVEAVSHSPYWDDTAIFVVEDDAQNGVDHVDAHRSIAFVISKYSPGSTEKPFLEGHFYTTVNLIHTMEELLGLPPMNLNDAYAPVMSAMFSGVGNQPAFSADFRNRDNGLIYQTNPKRARDAHASLRLDFSRPDAADSATLNAILWRASKGSAPMPAPRFSVFPAEDVDDR